MNAGIVLDRAVVDLTGAEETEDARVEPILVDTGRHVAKVLGDRGQPHDRGKQGHGRQPEPEAVGGSPDAQVRDDLRAAMRINGGGPASGR